MTACNLRAVVNVTDTMTFIEGIPEEVVLKSLLPKLTVPLSRRDECVIDYVQVKAVLQRLRTCWALSTLWKATIERTVEWAAWRLARWEAEAYLAESTAPGYSLLEIDPTHRLFGKADAVSNFIVNFNAFARSKRIWVHCKRLPWLTSRELYLPMNLLTVAELLRIRNVLTKSVIAINKESTGQTWVPPRYRLD